MTSFNLYEAYAAVYDEDLREELLIEETILLESIDELNDDELEEIVEDSIYSMLDEGYDIDEVEEIFEETFSEARVDMAARIAQRKKEAAESEKSAKQARSKGASVVRKEKRAEAVGRIKGAVKKVASDIKSAAQKNCW
jgi:NCAIR mutase (PurE)-related protein